MTDEELMKEIVDHHLHQLRTRSMAPRRNEEVFALFDAADDLLETTLWGLEEPLYLTLGLELLDQAGLSREAQLEICRALRRRLDQ